MIVEVQRGSILQVPASFPEVSATKLYTNGGRLFAVAVENGDGTVSFTSAGDPDFAAYCAQYGIMAVPAQKMSLDEH